MKEHVYKQTVCTPG